MLIADIFKKIGQNIKADRIGPDIPFTHWRLHYTKTMRKLCESKFKKFADDAQFRPGAYAISCSQIEIGKRVVIRPQSMLFAETANKQDVSIVIEDDVMMGSGVHIYVSNHRFDNPDRPIIEQGHSPSQQVRIEKGSWLGANVIVLPGVTIGQNSVIGAGAVVTSSIPAHSVAVGCPAKVIKSI